MLVKITPTSLLFLLATLTTARPHSSKPNTPPSSGASPNPINQQPPSTNGTTPTTIDPNLVPDFGIQRGQKLPNRADCAGLNNKAIPCQCPPKRDVFISKLSAFVDAGNAFGTPVKFPEGNDADSRRQRIGALTVTLQNLEGPGKGCPIVSTRFGELQ